MSIEDNIAAIREKIDLALKGSHYHGAQVAIVCVSKARQLDEIYRALDAGVKIIGESRIQEAEFKIDAIKRYAARKDLACSFHMIGHLQTNKAAKALQLFDAIQSVDSLRLCEKIHGLSERAGIKKEILIEVNVSGEQSKFGVSPQELLPLLRKANALEGICVKGLMTIAPYSDDKEAARPYFRALRQTFDQINELRLRDPHLNRIRMEYCSMGMSADYEVAVQEGSTMVRIGSAIFEGA